MSDYSFLNSRQRNKTLILVEGKHEKDIFIKLLLSIFPEIPIKYSNVYIYGTDVYDLNEKIKKEYGEEWDGDSADIDIPFLLYKNGIIDFELRKRDVSNIILIFDYEHHDNLYTDETILKLQKHFCDMTDDGLLYINYPMMESYEHIYSIPDNGYINRKIFLQACSPGKVYKEHIHKEALVYKFVSGYEKIRLRIEELHGLSDEEYQEITRGVLSIAVNKEQYGRTLEFLRRFCKNEQKVEKIAHAIVTICKGLYKYFDSEQNIYDVLRKCFLYLSIENIRKAILISTGIDCKKLSKEENHVIDWKEVLEVQNQSSADIGGFIWVLNTSITMIAEYRFFWQYVETNLQ